jgi:hypothetical protein
MSEPEKSPPGKKRCRLRLTRRQQDDYKPLLDATRLALKSQCDLVLEVRTCDDSSDVPEPEQPPERRLAAEQLEAAALRHAAAALDSRAAEVEKAPETQSDGSSWWDRVKAFGKLVGGLAKEGIKVVIGESVKTAMKGGGGAGA